MAARRLSFALAVALAAAPARPARAEGDAGAAKREAAEHFQKGVRFFHDGEYPSALVEFRRAHDLLPDYRVLYNLGQTSRELKDHAGALAAFERYLAEGKGAIAPKRKRKVAGAIAELRAKVAELRVEVDVAGAELSVDDEPVGTAPLAAPITLNPGRRKVAARHAGYAPTQRFVDLAGADRVTVSLALTPLPRAAPEPPPPPPPAPRPAAPPPRRERAIWPWVGLAGTGALALTAGALGVQSLRAHASFEDALDERTSAREVDDARSEARAWALATDIAGGLAVAGAVTTVFLFWADRHAAPAAKARLDVTPGGLRVRF
ncbi:MAG TPA: PEGA domain-containing protein [Polyangiaceae bacterium]|nr:PEGA domain-containing protein [Polyangiaceae bacterium]